MELLSPVVGIVKRHSVRHHEGGELHPAFGKFIVEGAPVDFQLPSVRRMAFHQAEDTR